MEEAHKQHLAKSGNAAELVHGGDVHAGIETYAQRNEWDAALQLASQQGPHMLVKYATLHGAALIQQSTYAGAAKAASFGIIPSDVTLSLLRGMSRSMLRAGTLESGRVRFSSCTWRARRDFLLIFSQYVALKGRML